MHNERQGEQLGSAARRKRQAGLSTWEGLLLLFMLGGYFYLGLGLYEPVWDRWKTLDMIETTIADNETMAKGPAAIKSSIAKRLSINGIYSVSAKNISVKRTPKAIRIEVDQPLIAKFPWDIEAVVQIKKTWEVPHQRK